MKSGRGGQRKGAGRPKKENQVVFYVRCTPTEKEKLKTYWDEMKKS